MASTYSPNLALTLIGTGDQAGAWGNTTNTNLGTLIEQAISGYVTQVIADGGDTTITIPNGASGVARNMYLELTGALTAARNLIVPTNKKLYVVYNNTTGGYAVTVKVSGQTGVSVPNGKKMILVSNGTDIVDAINNLSGTATNITGVAAIANGGTALSTIPTNGQLLIGNGTGYSLANLTAGANVTITNSAGGITIAASGGGGGGTVTSVSASSPLASTGGTTPIISLNGVVGSGNGGTGVSTTPTNGQLLIGNGSGYSLANLTAGSNVTITNSAGGITIAATGGGGSTGDITFSTNTISTLNTNENMLLVPNGTGRVYINGLQVGPGKGSSNTNTVFGSTAGNALTSGTYNVTIGYYSGNQITSGSENITIGYAGDVNLKTTNANVLIGHFAGSYANGNNNTAVGRTALGTGTGGNYNTAVGSQALTNSGSYSNSSGLGSGTDVTGNNQVQLGDSTTTTYAYGAVQNRSDARDKADIQDTDLGLNFIMALRPRKFKWDMREDYKPPMPDINTATPEELKAWQDACNLSNITHDGSKTRNRYHQGLIAQEVKSTMDAMGVDFGGYQDHSINGGQDVKSIGYNELVAPLIKAIQELKAEFDEYKRTHP